VGADASGKTDFAFPDGAFVLVLGSEGSGLSEAARAACTDRVALRMLGGPGSLNVAVAGGILMYKSAGL
jgi:tRNA G18 (ribose-2'-O)-methylase SpoU